MRVMIVGFITFLFMAFILWLSGAFISGVWAPMAWDGFGRFTYVLLLFTLALPISIFGGIGYYEEVEKKRRR